MMKAINALRVMPYKGCKLDFVRYEQSDGRQSMSDSS